MSDDELELNTFSRFAKRSPRLVLEEHGHCEVPAGGGGVVLRWRNPQAGLTAVLQRAGSGRTTAFLDGVAPTSSFLTLSFGKHVLAEQIETKLAEWSMHRPGAEDGDGVGRRVDPRERFG